MFLLRCAFWLSVVYATMWWHAGTPNNRHLATALVTTGGGTVETLAQSAAAQVGDACRGRPEACLAQAARLTALVKASLTNEDDGSVTSPPLPVRDPRRHIRGAMSGQKS